MYCTEEDYKWTDSNKNVYEEHEKMEILWTKKMLDEQIQAKDVIDLFRTIEVDERHLLASVSLNPPVFGSQCSKRS